MCKDVHQDKSDVDLFYELRGSSCQRERLGHLVFEILLRIYAVGLGIQRDEDGYFESREEYEKRMEEEHGSR